MKLQRIQTLATVCLSVRKLENVTKSFLSWHLLMGVDWNVKPYHLFQLLVLTPTVELYIL